MNQEKASKVIEQLLKSPAGRQVLGKKLNLQFADEQQALPRVAILVPCYDKPEPAMSNALVNLMQFTNKSGKATCFQGQMIRNASVVHFVRNELITMLLKSKEPFTHILFIDDDICPQPDALVRLLAHQKEVVGAVCTRRQDPPIPNIRWWDEEELVFREIWNWPKDKLIQVGGMGAGMILISVKAMDAVTEAYLNCSYEKEMYQLPESRAEFISSQRRSQFDRTARCMWFRFLPGLLGYSEMGEDVSFSLMSWRYGGITVYCDTSVQPTHIGSYGFGVEDFEHYRELAIERAKADGQFKEPPAPIEAVSA